MKTVGIVNFHAAINYGSALLAYALQRTISDMGYDCQIINYQPKRQIECYRLPILVSRNPIKRWIESLYWGGDGKQMEQKYEKFHQFAHDYMRLTPYCNEPEHINDICGTFDFYIAGGDQIWNTKCADFEWYYYLDFVKNGKKIAYAPSMGPGGSAVISNDEVNKVKQEVSTFSAVAVRDSGTAELFDSNFEIVLDPTMLLTTDEWSQLAGDKPLINGEYVFYYDPFDHDMSKLAAREYAKTHNCKIVSSNIYMIFKKDSKTFNYNLNVGPLEFLNLVKYAKFCIGRSFHLCAFSLLFHKEFKMVDGLRDKRNLELANLLFADVTLLRKGGGEDMVINSADYTEIFEKRLIEQRKKSIRFLAEALNCKKVE